MKKVFELGEGFTVPDGTIVHPAIDSKVAIDEISVAMGVIPQDTKSKIHIHPVVNQVTWVLEGQLSVVMKDPDLDTPYKLDLSTNQSVVTKAGTFFQLINSSNESCKVLYIVSPAFVFECNERGEVVYNDAVVLDESWDELERHDWILSSIPSQRSAALEREKSIKKN